MSKRIRISGSPTSEEQAIIAAALEQIQHVDELESTPSSWKISGRAGATRIGILELRHRLASRSWQSSTRFGWAGERESTLKGRGDAK